MSFVGPRPLIREELDKYYTQDEQKILLSVKPGVTGYWQAYGRNTIGYAEHKRQNMELYYAQKSGFWFDMKIMFKTVLVLALENGTRLVRYVFSLKNMVVHLTKR